MKTYELDTLKAILRLSRSRTKATVDHLADRVDASRAELVIGLDRLERAGLLYRVGEEVRLQMSGLAIAYAYRAKSVKKTTKFVPEAARSKAA
ncbi:MAG: hypothetical protein KBF88_16970 [Polyangiaceae bacterium]|nr:hypothetical protein [Polyangiaceae bacterium]